eukprot:4231686-Prymnesium_polylepis.1
MQVHVSYRIHNRAVHARPPHCLQFPFSGADNSCVAKMLSLSFILPLAQSSLTAQTAVVIETGTTNYLSAASFDSTNGVACFQDSGDSGKGKCAHLGRSGTTITAQTAVVIETGSTKFTSLAAFDSANAVACFVDGGDSNKGKCAHLGLSGTAITAQTAVEIEAGTTAYTSVAAFDSTNAVACFVDRGDSNKAKCVHLGRSGTTITAQTAVEIEAGASLYVSVAAFDSTNAVACFEDDADSDKS